MAKALHVCRQLRAAGWRVVLVETHKYWHVGSRLSNSVDVFARVPIPELYPDNYKQAIAGEVVKAVVAWNIMLPPAAGALHRQTYGRAGKMAIELAASQLLPSPPQGRY